MGVFLLQCLLCIGLTQVYGQNPVQLPYMQNFVPPAIPYDWGPQMDYMPQPYDYQQYGRGYGGQGGYGGHGGYGGQGGYGGRGGQVPTAYGGITPDGFHGTFNDGNFRVEGSFPHPQGSTPNIGWGQMGPGGYEGQFSDGRMSFSGNYPTGGGRPRGSANPGWYHPPGFDSDINWYPSDFSGRGSGHMSGYGQGQGSGRSGYGQGSGSGYGQGSGSGYGSRSGGSSYGSGGDKGKDSNYNSYKVYKEQPCRVEENGTEIWGRQCFFSQCNVTTPGVCDGGSRVNITYCSKPSLPVLACPRVCAVQGSRGDRQDKEGLLCNCTLGPVPTTYQSDRVSLYFCVGPIHYLSEDEMRKYNRPRPGMTDPRSCRPAPPGRQPSHEEWHQMASHKMHMASPNFY